MIVDRLTDAGSHLAGGQHEIGGRLDTSPRALAQSGELWRNSGNEHLRY
jgi:hypothetical protein